MNTQKSAHTALPNFLKALLLTLSFALTSPIHAEEATAPPIPELLDLDTAQAIALEQNRTLQAVGEIVLQARERVKQARSAYFPQLTAEYTATHTELSEQILKDANKQVRRQAISGIGQSVGRAFSSNNANAGAAAAGGTLFNLYTSSIAYDSIDDSVERYQASLNAQFLVFDGFARRFQYAQARFGADETEAAHREARRLILDAIAQAYFGVQLAREGVDIYQADMTFNTRLLEDAKARRAQGLGSLSDELNFEVLLRAAKSQLIVAEGDYRAARIALASLMGLDDAMLPEATQIAPLENETSDEMTLPEADPLLAKALHLRPDVDRQELGAKRATAAIGQKKGKYYPQIGAFATADATRSENGRINDGDITSTVGLNVRMDLFTGGRNRAAVAEARHAAREATARLEDAEINAQAEVRTALEKLNTAQASLILQRTTAELVEKNRDLVEKEYDAGQTALVRLNQAQRDLVAAQARLALARVSLKSAWHGLRTATGETVAAD